MTTPIVKHITDDIDGYIARGYNCITEITSVIQEMIRLRPFLARMSPDASSSTFIASTWIRIETKHRADFAILREAFPGAKWDRLFDCDKGCFEYRLHSSTFGKVWTSCFVSETPPSCTVSEEKVMVPAREETRFKVNCKKGTTNENE